jgi:hypothetical protein
MLPLDDSSRVSSTRPRCHHKLLERGCQQGPALFPQMRARRRSGGFVHANARCCIPGAHEGTDLIAKRLFEGKLSHGALVGVEWKRTRGCSARVLESRSCGDAACHRQHH